MNIIGASDAKTHLATLLKRVSEGETFQITVRGVPVARLVPAIAEYTAQRRDLVRDIRQLRKGITLGKSTVRQLIDSGRRH
ncbi:MAG: type II toxin-antitoxin system prevent-host-death family antitoxin [Acidobacteriia bacterium]|nr:type II toxin-antitoxin system prevent-host-death family antitoxin [Terriglobia bacterium]